MDDKLEKKFYTELVSESYKTTDINKISEKIKKSINVNITPKEVYNILNEDYELEYRKMEYGLQMSYIFD